VVGRDPYEILGIARDATLAEASAAYRRVAQLFHPDRLGAARQDVRREGERRLREATEAINAIRSRFGRPLVVRRRQRDRDPAAPSEAATAREARLYEVDLRERGGSLHVRWHGQHAAAVLAALRDGHRIDGPIRQVEWGTYEIELDGAATRGLLGAVPGDDWRQQPVEVIAGSDRLLPARRDDDEHALRLADLVAVLADGNTYSILADVY
jgi:hypothetical protein